MSTCIITNGTARFFDENAVAVAPSLPVGVYTLGMDMESMYLERTEPFRLPERFYGSTLADADRIWSTFEDRQVSTGVLLSGNKGSGKTLLAKTVGMRALANGMPVILVNHPWPADPFMQLMSRITSNCVVIFDEFEKMFSDKGAQDKILTLFDGVMSSKKLFMLTSNDTYAVSRYLLNRPGRIYYSLTFDRLEGDFVRDYCREHLVDQDQVEKVLGLASMIQEFNFDMLQALVEELNRYGGDVISTLRFMNIDPQADSYGNPRDYKMVAMIGTHAQVVDEDFTMNPVKFRFHVFDHIIEGLCKSAGVLPKKMGLAVDDDGELSHLTFTESDLAEIRAEEGIYVYRKNGVQLVATKVKPSFNYAKLL